MQEIIILLPHFYTRQQYNDLIKIQACSNQYQ